MEPFQNQSHFWQVGDWEGSKFWSFLLLHVLMSILSLLLIDLRFPPQTIHMEMCIQICIYQYIFFSQSRDFKIQFDMFKLSRSVSQIFRELWIPGGRQLLICTLVLKEPINFVEFRIHKGPDCSSTPGIKPRVSEHSKLSHTESDHCSIWPNTVDAGFHVVKWVFLASTERCQELLHAEPLNYHCIVMALPLKCTFLTLVLLTSISAGV